MDELQAMSTDIGTKFGEKIEIIANLFDEERYEEIKKEIHQAKYLEKMLEEISIAESKLKYSGEQDQ